MSRIGETESARRDHDDLRRERAHVLELDAHRIAARPPERIVTARDLHHLRHPVAAAEEGVRPLEEDHATPPTMASRCLHGLQARVIPRDDLPRLRFPADRPPDSQNILVDVGQVAWREVENLRLARQGRDRPRQLVPRRRAHLTQVLREDHVRREREQQLLVHEVVTLAALELGRDGLVDIGRAHPLEVERGTADDRQTLYDRRVVALMRPADQLITGSECVYDLATRWQKGNNSRHRRTGI